MRDLTDASGRVMASYDYDPYGKPTSTRVFEWAGGSPRADYRYAGLFYHAPSGLYLTHYRVYDPITARWLSRDPIGETGGINLYGYVEGNPVSQVDPLGLLNTATVHLGGVGGGSPGGSSGAIGGMGGGAGNAAAAVVGAGLGAWGACQVWDGYGGESSDAETSADKPQQCDEKDAKCDQLLATDTATCNGISRMRGRAAGARCHASASQRYAACLRGQPIPPLDTWNN